ncbi:RNA-directed DNA polymerase [Legionella santicrucis]|uniref:RNA-directed DNA polymerase n=1 Tax=Legionella santicrucis TaxID=45074 RepID=A0A0W0Z656_9GAMM|nr:group II intron maturase-specific domain-containing protein [Legionella santicrucis]KTD64589.1 RNA-directed DNA polymerase [Legionella santicrucis]
MRFPWATRRLLHCQTEQEAQKILMILAERFKECGLELHPAKTKVVYCKNSNRVGSYPRMSFDFLGYTFRPRVVKNPQTRKLFVGFTPAVSKNAMKSMCDKTRKYKWHLRSGLSLEEIARIYNPVLQGWLNYYGRYCPSELVRVWRYFNRVLVKWAMRKHKKFKGRKSKAAQFLEKVAAENPTLFAHWMLGTGKTFA